MSRNKISLSGETYVGFDTEYVPLDYGINKLVSVQLSITTGIKLKIPIVNCFKFEGLNTVSSEKFDIKVPRVDNIDAFVSYMNKLVTINRINMYSSYDDKLVNISNYLIKNKEELKIDGIKRIEDGYLFKFEKSVIENLFIRSEGEEELKINFDTLNKIVYDNSHDKIEEEQSRISSILNSCLDLNSSSLLDCELKTPS
jgi:hypothetical protein